MTKKTLVKTYNKKGEDAGVETREAAERKGLILASVVVALFDQDDKVWLSLRSHKKSTHRGKWDLAVSGCVDAVDATNLAAAQRESKEEAGLELDLQSAGRMRLVFPENGNDVIRFPEVFYAQTSQIPRISNDEVDGFARFPIPVLREHVAQNPNNYVPTVLEEIEFAYEHLRGEQS